jgi:hypothetical protein
VISVDAAAAAAAFSFAMAIMDDLAFGFLLSPRTLAERSDELSPAETKGLLKTYLGLLQTEKARAMLASAAAAPAAVQTEEGGGGADVVMLSSPGDPPAPSSFAGAAPAPTSAATAATATAPPPPPPLVTRKQAVLQLLCLQLSAQLHWSLSDLAGELSLSLQQQFFDCLTAATRTQKSLSELTVDNVEETVRGLAADSGGPFAAFAVALFFQWVVRCAAPPLPLPTGTKAAILAGAANGHAAGTFTLPILPGAVNGAAASEALQQWVASLAPLALKVLRHMLEVGVECPLPPFGAATLLPDNQVVLEKPSNGDQLDARAWIHLAHFELARYSLCVEDYAAARTHVAALGERPTLPSKEATVFGGLRRALADPDDLDNRVPAFVNHCTASEGRQMLARAKKEEIPIYAKVNYEHLARYHLAVAADDLAALTARSRVKCGAAPTFNMFSPKAPEVEKTEGDSKSLVFTAVQQVSHTSGNEDEVKETVDLLPRLGDAKTRDQRVRRRQILSALLRETKPLKVQKLVAETQKLPPAIRRLGLAPAETGADPAAQAFLSQFGRGQEADTAQAFVSKAGQMIKQGKLEEAASLSQAAEEADRAKNHGGNSPPLKALQRRWFGARMALKAKKGLTASPNEQEICRSILFEMRLIQPDLGGEQQLQGVGVVEAALVTLVNLEDWEFLMTLQPEPKYPIAHTVQIIISLAMVLRGETLTLDIKKSCLNLLEALKPLLSPPAFAMGSGKRARASAAAAAEASLKDDGRRVLTRVLASVRHPQFLQVAIALLTALYNEKADEASARLQCDVPALPFAAPPVSAGTAHDLLDVIQSIVAEKYVMPVLLDEHWSMVCLFVVSM